MENFQSSAEKELEEIRQQKAEVQALKTELQNELHRGLYYRDGDRLIVSAPEIIIGNVDDNGMLMGGSSKVIIRASEVDLEGVGEAGAVHTRAASIRQTAVDPCIDGHEQVVQPMSEVVSQATNIIIESNNATDVFSQRAVPVGRGGVRIHADGRLQLEASITAKKHKAALEARIKELEKAKSELEKIVDSQKSNFEKLSNKLEKILDKQEELAGDEGSDVRANYVDIDELQDDYTFYSHTLARTVDSWIENISTLAEVNRQLKVLKEEKNAAPSDSDFKKKGTGASVAIIGERIDLVSADGEGNLRDNEGAGVGILANEVTIESREYDKSLKKEGSVSISAQTLNFSTVNPTGIELDDKGEINNAKYPVTGDVFVRSKNITFESVDNEIEKSKPKETALTKGGKIAMRAETMDFSATDTEGKATGSIGLNSKSVSIRSMDVDKDKRTDKSLTEGSTMLLLAEKMYVGAKNDKNKSKKIQAVGEEVGLFADNTLEAQQGKAKAVLQLADGNAAIGGGETQIFGTTTVKAELKTPKATVDNLEAKNSFKSMNISDGMAPPGGAPGGSISAKLKTEDAPDNAKNENKS